MHTGSGLLKAAGAVFFTDGNLPCRVEVKCIENPKTFYTLLNKNTVSSSAAVRPPICECTAQSSPRRSQFKPLPEVFLQVFFALAVRSPSIAEYSKP